MSDKVILCVEDNPQVQAFNKLLLEARGFAVALAMTLAQARAFLARQFPCLIVLDIHLPDGNGLDFLRELRHSSDIPVIALTDDREDADIIAGFAGGCDDYVTKPYTFPVLYARIEGLLRRARNVPDAIERGSLRLNVLAGQAFLGGKDLLLTQKEFSLLLYLVQHENQPINAEKLYESIWKTPAGDDKRTLQKHVSSLRKKLEDGGSGYTVRAVYGKGYCIERI